MKMWMVQGTWDIDGMLVPVRSVVEARTKKKAQEGAKEAVRKAVQTITDQESPDGTIRDAMVLYAM